ncbi:LysR family transcriptional regulator [uncultured Enterovirga sp.]|uniref:LysR family transcriptional regulator n=1 Tax=uncultured Enterovirga sp. TaxID=2026352 RepID=UPI0035C99CC6
MLDWDDLRFFLAVARHRTLAAAAKHLRVTQSTVGRRLNSAQGRLGVRLLQRTTEGYILTLAGESVRTHVERIEEEALWIERTVGGHDIRLEGVVRVASSQLLTSHLLAPCFAALHAQHPDILIEALPIVEGEPLAAQDVHIALQFLKFEQHDVLLRRIGDVAFGLYGSRSYLAAHGGPDLESGCSGAHLITLLDHRELSEQAAWLVEHAGRAQVVLKADSYETQFAAAASGGGLALLPRFRADAESTLSMVPTSTPAPGAQVWLGVHRENRQVPRIRTVLDCIADAVRDRLAGT